MTDAVTEFVSVTRVAHETAQQYLSRAGGDLNRATDIYFQDLASITQPAAPPPRPTPPATAAPTRSQSNPSKSQFDAQLIFQTLLSHRLPGPYRQEPSDVPFEQHTITIWRNGFRLDGGDFRPITDPKNQQFLIAISAEQIPPELMRPGIEVDLELEDETERDCPDPANNSASRPRRSQSQPQQQLPAPSHSQQPSQPPAQYQQQQGVQLSIPSQSLAQYQTAQPSLPSQPHVQYQQQQGAQSAAKDQKVQVKFHFPDHQAELVFVGLEETVGDLKRRVVQLHPELGSKPFALTALTSPSPLLDDSKTVREANLMRTLIKISYS
jgi:UBX domain-containing protein 1